MMSNELERSAREAQAAAQAVHDAGAVSAAREAAEVADRMRRTRSVLDESVFRAAVEDADRIHQAQEVLLEDRIFRAQKALMDETASRAAETQPAVEGLDPVLRAREALDAGTMKELERYEESRDSMVDFVTRQQEEVAERKRRDARLLELAEENGRRTAEGVELQRKHGKLLREQGRLLLSHEELLGTQAKTSRGILIFAIIAAVLSAIGIVVSILP